MTDGVHHPRSAEEIRAWLVARLTGEMNIAPRDVRTDEPLIAHGVDSMQFVALVGEMEQWLGCRFVDNPLIEYPTIDALAEFLAVQLRQGKTLIDPARGQ